MTKLTLSTNKDVVEKAKRLAQQRGMSVSALFSQYIRSLASDADESTPRLGPITRKAIGLVSLPEGKSDRELMEEALLERHGR